MTKIIQKIICYRAHNFYITEKNNLGKFNLNKQDQMSAKKFTSKSLF